MKDYQFRTLFISVTLLIAGCTVLLNKAPEKEGVKIDKCSYEEGFNASVEGQIPNERCLSRVDNNYKKGILNGHSYLKRKEQVDSLDKHISDKQKTFDYLLKNYSVNVSRWKELQYYRDDISNMKKEKRFIEADINSFKFKDNL